MSLPEIWPYLTTLAGEEAAVIVGASRAFALATLLSAGVLWGIFHYAYKQRLATKDKERTRLEEQLALERLSAEVQIARLKERLAPVEEQRQGRGRASEAKINIR